MKKHKCAWKVCKLSFPTLENVLKSNKQIPFFKKRSHPSQLLQLSLFHYKKLQININLHKVKSFLILA